MRPLHKTTIVIWSEYDPFPNLELTDLAREAEIGDAYCSSCEVERVEDPEKDETWDGTEFFEEAQW